MIKEICSRRANRAIVQYLGQTECLCWFNVSSENHLVKVMFFFVLITLHYIVFKIEIRCPSVLNSCSTAKDDMTLRASYRWHVGAFSFFQTDHCKHAKYYLFPRERHSLQVMVIVKSGTCYAVNKKNSSAFYFILFYFFALLCVVVVLD